MTVLPRIQIFSVPPIITSVKNSIEILIGVSLSLRIAFCKMAIFTTLILSIHEHKKAFHLLVPSLIYYFRVYNILF